MATARAGRPAVALPFVKWAGGKRRLAPTILAVAPPRFGRYLEPFVGGGAVALALGHRPMLLNDANAELMAAYGAVRDDLPALLRLLDAHRAAHGPAHYYRQRALDPTGLAPTARAARLIYLNKTCFNGLYRVNRRGAFNVPLGRSLGAAACPPLYDAAELAAAAAALRDCTLSADDYGRFLRREARPGDFIYLDPPYVPVGRYADFKRYTPGQFGEADQRALAALYDELVELGAYPVLSNSDAPLVRELYGQHRLRPVTAGRSINHDGAGRGPVGELVVTPGPRRARRAVA